MNLAFPLTIDSRGYSGAVNGSSYVKQLIEQVLFTYPGERVNQPGFGTPIANLVFDNLTEELAQVVKEMVLGALQQNLADRVLIEDVAVEVEENQLIVTVRYTELQDNRTETVQLANALSDLTNTSL